jgi:hypothetical protein
VLLQPRNVSFVSWIDNTASSSSPDRGSSFWITVYDPVYNISNDALDFHNALLQLSSCGNGSRDIDLLLLKVFSHCLVHAVSREFCTQLIGLNKTFHLSLGKFSWTEIAVVAGKSKGHVMACVRNVVSLIGLFVENFDTIQLIHLII